MLLYPNFRYFPEDPIIYNISIDKYNILRLNSCLCFYVFTVSVFFEYSLMMFKRLIPTKFYGVQSPTD